MIFRRTPRPTASDAASDLVLCNDGASLDLVDRVRDAILRGRYSAMTPRSPVTTPRPADLAVSGPAHVSMRLHERAMGIPVLAPFVRWSLMPVARRPLPHDRYAHVAWTDDLCAYPDDEALDSLATARAAFAAPMLTARGSRRLVELLEGIASLACASGDLAPSVSIACSAGTPWSPPTIASTDTIPAEIAWKRGLAMSMPDMAFPPRRIGTMPVDPTTAASIPTVLVVRERHDDKGSRLVLSPLTAIIRRRDAIDPMATLRILADAARDPIRSDATPDGRPASAGSETIGSDVDTRHPTRRNARDTSSAGDGIPS